jgi:hypothetical protein
MPKNNYDQFSVRDFTLPLWGAVEGIFWSNFKWFHQTLPLSIEAPLCVVLGLLGVALVVYIACGIGATLGKKGW